MTGVQENLHKFIQVSAGRVTFGDGAKGKFRGKGVTGGEAQPNLEKIYLIDG